MTHSSSFHTHLNALVAKHDYAVEDVAQLANTSTFVVREWMRGTAVPVGAIRRGVLNALDDPNATRNVTRGFLGTATQTLWQRPVFANGL